MEKVMEEIEEIGKKVKEREDLAEKILKELMDVQDKLANKVKKIEGLNIAFETEQGNIIRFSEKTWRFGTGRVVYYYITVNDKFLTDKAEKLGNSTYWYGDFNNYAEFVTLEEAIDLANNIEKLITLVKQEIERQNSKSKDVLEKLSNCDLGSIF